MSFKRFAAREVSGDGKWSMYVLVSVIVAFSILILCFVWLAYRTFTGSVMEIEYHKGLDFQKIYASSLQKPDNALKAQIVLSDKSVRFIISAKEPYKLWARLVKPVTSEFDRELRLEQDADDTFIGDIGYLPRGMWEIRLLCEYKDGRKYVFNKRFMR